MAIAAIGAVAAAQYGAGAPQPPRRCACRPAATPALTEAKRHTFRPVDPSRVPAADRTLVASRASGGLPRAMPSISRWGSAPACCLWPVSEDRAARRPVHAEVRRRGLLGRTDRRGLPGQWGMVERAQPAVKALPF